MEEFEQDCATAILECLLPCVGPNPCFLINTAEADAILKSSTAHTITIPYIVSSNPSVKY